jgi:putative ABC transport system ATP-binding protein
VTSVPLVRAIELEKVYRTDTVQTHAVNQISFDLATGEYLVLSGPSGCGKSSLLAMLGLMDPPSSGELHVEGMDTSRIDDGERARLRGVKLGFVFQAFHLIPHLSVRENIQLPLGYHRGWSASEQRERAEAAALDVGMSHRLDHYPDQLSGGQQQRVAVARALAGSPALILADEPTGNLDSDNGDQLMRLLEAVHAKGAAICLVTHDARYQTAGQRTLHMRDGRIVDDQRR